MCLMGAEADGGWECLDFNAVDVYRLILFVSSYRDSMMFKMKELIEGGMERLDVSNHKRVLYMQIDADIIGYLCSSSVV